MATDEKRPPMYFTSLKLKNVKCFGDTQSLNLLNEDGTVARWTLILGDNGIGKTTLLKCLSWMTPVESPEKPEQIEKRRIAGELVAANIGKDLISKATGLSIEEIDSPERNVLKVKPLMDDFADTVIEKMLRAGENVKATIEAEFANDCKIGAAPKPEKIIKISIDFESEGGKITEITPHTAEILSFNSPNLYAYSASRHIAYNNFERTELSDPIYNLFSDSGDLYDAEQVLSYLDYASTKEKADNEALTDDVVENLTSTKLLEKVKKLLVDLLPDIDKPESIIINPPMFASGEKTEKLVEIETKNGRIPLFDISLGYQTMLSWAVDLAIRMLWKNPGSDNPLDEPAVVIIDEIDLHLHPKWQRNLRTFLTKNFKKTQFICTAHSPFMAQALEDENLCVLRHIGLSTKIDNDPEIVQGWRIGQIVTSELFDITSERSFLIDKKIRRRRTLLRKDELTDKDTAELESLNQEIDQLPVGENKSQDDAMKLLRDFAEKLDAAKARNNDQN
jgi:energy-coupling factor transporter ATP-binding protein EcfA2